jgi:hypothetical protein
MLHLDALAVVASSGKRYTYQASCIQQRSFRRVLQFSIARNAFIAVSRAEQAANNLQQAYGMGLLQQQ